MYTFNTAETDLLNNAIDMALASNKRMLTSKPQFADIFKQIQRDYEQLKIKINTVPQTPKQK